MTKAIWGSDWLGLSHMIMISTLLGSHGLGIGEEWLPKEKWGLLPQEREVDAGWQDKQNQTNFKGPTNVWNTNLLIKHFNKPLIHVKEGSYRENRIMGSEVDLGSGVGGETQERSNWDFVKWLFQVLLESTGFLTGMVKGLSLHQAWGLAKIESALVDIVQSRDLGYM